APARPADDLGSRWRTGQALRQRQGHSGDGDAAWRRHGGARPRRLRRRHARHPGGRDQRVARRDRSHLRRRQRRRQPVAPRRLSTAGIQPPPRARRVARKSILPLARVPVSLHGFTASIRMPARFVHTHLHSEYSLVDSTIRIKALVAACVQAGMPAVALTDECNMFALVKFYKACSAAGIKPICGSDLWIAAPDDPRAWQEGQHGGRALVEAGWLTAAATDGLIALLGRESETARIALSQGHDAALAKLRPLARLFPDRLYLQLTRCGREGEETWNQAALALATELALPVVAGNDVRFLKRDDFEAHEARVCIHQGRVLA